MCVVAMQDGRNEQEERYRLLIESIRDWIWESDLEGTFSEQIETADLVLLNKTDLVAESELPRLLAAVDAMNPGVPVLPCVRGDVDPRLLLAASTTPRGPLTHAPEPAHEFAAETTHIRRFAAVGSIEPGGEIRQLPELDENDEQPAQCRHRPALQRAANTTAVQHRRLLGRLAQFSAGRMSHRG